jgi:small-conductance mechanosensitive channel
MWTILVYFLVCFLDTGFSSILSTSSSTLISLSFIFSVTAQEFLGSCIFLFLKHPYDISDRVDIYGPDGVNLSRSKSILERLDLYISFETPLSDIETLRLEMEKFILQTYNRDFQPDIVLRCLGVGSMDKLQL